LHASSHLSHWVFSVVRPPQENEVEQGHHLATLICSACHVAAPDQDFEPILRPPAPPFASIAQRRDLTADFLQTFLSTTHRDVLNPKGMPNPLLLDYQIKQHPEPGQTFVTNERLRTDVNSRIRLAPFDHPTVISLTRRVRCGR
jgi:hypothetical protein